MRTLLTRRSAAPVDDDALLARRRTIETAALISRSVGLVSTGLAATGAGMAAAMSATAGMREACYTGMAAMALSNVFSHLGRRRPGAAWYQPLSAAQVVLDTATIVGLVVLSSNGSETTTWPLLSLAVAVAALRHQLLGAMLAWAVTSVAFALLVPDSGELSFVVGVSFMIAVITGTQSSSLHRHLTALNETRRELQHQATHDGLTGLPNRAHLDDYAARLTGRPLGVLLLDLNGFKQVNDTYGHAAGDRLLHQVAARLTAAAGDGAVAGRLGGDEFLVLLPGADQETVAGVCERIRTDVHRSADLGDGIVVTVGVSVGVALRPAGSGTGLDALTAEADAAMYREKQRRHAA